MTFPMIYRCRCCGYALKFKSSVDWTILKDMAFKFNENEIFCFHVPDWQELTVEEYNDLVLREGAESRDKQS